MDRMSQASSRPWSRNTAATSTRWIQRILAFVVIAQIAIVAAWAQSASFLSAQLPLGSAWQSPVATAVDTLGDLFVLDQARGEIDELAATQGRIPSAAVPVKIAGFSSLGNSSNPSALAVDTAGNLYVADKGAGVGAGAIREIKATSLGVYPSSPTVVTLASNLQAPAGVAVDAGGNLFITEAASGASAVGEILASSVGVFASPSLVSVGSSHSWVQPAGIALDGSGNPVVADMGNGSIQSISKASGYVTVTQDAAGFTAPSGVAVDASGDLFVTDATAATVTELVAVNGALPASPTSLALGTGWSKPAGLAIDIYGTLYVADATAAKPVIQLMTSGANLGAVALGSKSTTATLVFVFSAAGATAAPVVLTSGVSGLDFADKGTGSCTTGAGTTWNISTSCTVDVVFTPFVAGAQMGAVNLTSGSGTLLATAYLNGLGLGAVAGFSPGAVSGVTVFGLGASALSNAGAPVFDASGNLYIPDNGNNRLVKLAAPLGTISAATVVTTGLPNPTGAAVDGAGNLYLATGGNGVLSLSPAGAQTALYNNSLSFTNLSVAVDGAGNVYTADLTNNRIVWFPAGGAAQVFYTGGALNQPYGVAADAQGNLYVANYGGNNVVKISQGVATILSATYLSNGAQVSYSNPMAIALDAVGNVYVADTGNDQVVMIPQGTSNAFALSLNGKAVSLPVGVAVDRKGNLVVLDGADNSIWLSAQQTGPSLNFASTAVGSTSNSQSVTLLSLGNAALSLSGTPSAANPLVSGDFTLAANSTCPTIAAGGTTQSLAAGLNCNYDLTFTPAVIGARIGSLVLTDNASNSSSQMVSLSGTGAAPTILITPATGTLTDGSTSAAYNQQFKASGGTAPYTYALAAVTGTLPAGLSFTTSTGILSGTPTASGTVTLTITATDSSTVAEGGPYKSAATSYTLTVDSPTITVTPAALANGTAGAAYAAATFAASGGAAPYTFAMTSGTLPAGMTLTSGVLTGTPTAAGTYNVTVTATDANKATGNHDYSLTIQPPSLSLSPASGTLSDATAENTYSQQFSASGGTAPYAYTVSSGALPAGLTINSSGLLSGSPAATGAYTFTVQAADSTAGSGAPYTVTRSYTLIVYPPILSVVPMESVLAPATVGQTNYIVNFTAKGGNGTYTYALTAGSLPTGMSMVKGVLSGTPKTVSIFAFTITVTDSNLFTGSKSYTLAVGAPTINVTPANPVLAEGSAESQYTAVTFSATSTNGGTAPYSIALAAGTLPAGMSLTSGVLSGTPTVAGTYYLTVTATDANNQTGSREYALTLAPPVVTLTTSLLLDGAVGLTYRQTLSAAGGSGVFTYTASALPAWLTLDANGTLHGTPSASNIGTASFTVTATDSNGFAASRSYTVNVYALAATASGAQNLGTVELGTNATAAVTFTFNGNFALAQTPGVVLTDGAAGLDFTNAGSGSCVTGVVYGGNTATCTVKVSFAPTYPGLRKGVVQLFDLNGNLLASRLVYGVGKGAEANFLPAVQSTISSSIVLHTPQSLALDATGALYVADAGSNQVLKVSSGSASLLMSASNGLGTPTAIAIDGAGNVFIADPVKNTIWEIASGSSTPVAVISATVNTPSTPLHAPQGVAVDGAGNLYIADTGNSRILISTLTSTGYRVPVQLSTATALAAPVALTVSASGSIYIADATSNRILIEPASGTSTTLGNQGSELSITSGVSAPVAVVLDANVNLYIANGGTKTVLKAVYDAQGGYDVPAAVATTATLTSASGVAIDPSGIVYLSDSSAGVVYAENYSASKSALAFATTTGVGSLDATDGAQSFTLINAGNDALNFAAATGIGGTASTSFIFDPTSICDRQTSTLAANASCLFAIDFKPTVVGAPLTATLNLVYNSLAASSATKSIALTGTSVSTFTFTPGAGALTAGAVGVAYSQNIAVTSGGTAPFTYGTSAGTLPAGLTLSAAGLLSGTPTQAGDAAFTVTATDSLSDTGSVAYTLTIAADATAPTMQNATAQQTITFQFNNTATVASVLVLTQGVTGMDFTDAGAGTCDPTSNTSTTTYHSGDHCTVVVNFMAKYPGTRYGAIELLDTNGNLLASSYITGAGTGPLALFSPGATSTLSLKNLSTLGNRNGLSVPGGLAVDPADTVYVADVLNNRVLKVASNGTTTQVSTGTIALHYPTSVALDGAGNLFIASNGDGLVVEVTRNGNASVLDNGSLTLTNNFAVAVDGGGNVYTTDLGSTQNSTAARIVEYPAAGTAQAFAITGVTLSYPTGLAIDGSGTLWVADNTSIVAVKSSTGAALASGTLSTPLSAPVTLSVDGPGNLYIADGGNSRALILPAGSANLGSALPLNMGSLGTPFGVAIAGAGDLYLSDAQWNNIVVSKQEKPSELDFDTTVAVASSDQAMTLINAGNSTLNLPASTTAANPVFTNSPLKFALDSKASTCPILAAGGTTATLAAGNNCQYSINFTAAASGVVTDTLTLTDNSNNATSATQEVSISGSTVTVAPNSGTPLPAYVVTPGGTADAPYNSALSTTFTASGGTAPYSFGIASGSLPRGLSLSPDGILWGTPRNSGAFTFTVKATDSDGQAGTQVYSIAIAAATMSLTPAAGTLPTGTVLAPYSQIITASGGVAPYIYTLTSGTLPSGLELSRGGLLTGVPTNSASNLSLTVTATDAYGQTVSAIYALTVNPPPVVLSPASGPLPAGTTLIVYGQLFTASGGAMPYTFSVTAGALPAGLTLNAKTGLLSGTPTATGSFSFTVTATDSTNSGSVSGSAFTGSQSYTLILAAPVVTLSPHTLQNGAVGETYSQQLSAAGGAGPFTYAVTSGALPAGLTLAGGLIAGTPTAAGAKSFAITATDTITGGTATQTYQPTIYVAPATASPMAFATTQQVGSWSSTKATATFNFHGSSIVNGFTALTNSATNLEFKWAHSGTCTITEYNDGDSCTLDFYFKPSYPGQRVGAIELLDPNGVVLGTALISGSGVASVASFTPGTETTMASASSATPLVAPAGMAVDASGNVFVADSAAHRVLRITAAGAVTKILDLSASSGTPVAVALDGAGNLFVADTASTTIWRQTPPYSGAPTAVLSSTVNPPAAGLGSLGGIAFDAAGNIYFTMPATNLVDQMSQSPLTGFATPVQIATASSLSKPAAIAVDASGKLYIADTGNNRVVIEPVGGSTAVGQETVIGAGLNAPAGVAVDQNGNVYIANTGANTALKATLSGTSYSAPAAVATTATLASVAGVALDGRGNLYIADATSKTLLREDYSQPRPLVFAKKTIINTSDTTDGAISYTFFNAGNMALTAVAPGLTTATDFPQVAGSGVPADCTANFALAANSTCSLSVGFKPTVTGALSELIAFTDNSMAQSGATQSLHISATGLPTLNVTWSAPAAINYGTALSATQLNASAGAIPGSFVYTPPAGTIPNAGAQTLTAVFTPTDLVDYSAVTLTEPITVNEVTSTASLTANVNPSLFGAGVTFTVTVIPSAGTATGTVTFLDGTTVLGTGTLASGVATLTTTTLSAGTHSITAAYAGDGNCLGSTSAVLPQQVIDFSLTTTDSGTGGTTTVSQQGSAVVSLDIAPTSGVILPQVTTLTVSGQPVLSTVSLSGAGWVQQSATVWTLPANTPLSTVNLTIQLHASSAANRNPGPLWMRGAAPVLVGLLLLPFAARLRRTGRKLHRIAPVLLLAGVALLSTLLSSCSAEFVTIPSTYNVKVTVQSGSLTHTTTIQLKVD